MYILVCLILARTWSTVYVTCNFPWWCSVLRASINRISYDHRDNNTRIHKAQGAPSSWQVADVSCYHDDITGRDGIGQSPNSAVQSANRIECIAPEASQPVITARFRRSCYAPTNPQYAVTVLQAYYCRRLPYAVLGSSSRVRGRSDCTRIGGSVRSVNGASLVSMSSMDHLIKLY